jgi:plasmid stabilization system protein ParE
MALTIRLTPQAYADLDDIRSYLLPRSPQGAERVRQAIEATIDLLAAFPGIGRQTDIVDVHVLSAGRYPYLVYHALLAGELVVLHVRHSARDAPKPDDIQL